MIKKKILFSCGDRSADRYLSELLKSIKNSSTEIEKIVLGGNFSKPYCENFFEDLVGYDAHGFFSPITLLLKFLKLTIRIKNLFRLEKIDLVVLLDYYGFNIKIAKLAKKFNIPVIYYITPQVWATRKNRIKKIKKYVDLVINIYPFEQQIYKDNGIETRYFGHPILDVLDFSSTGEKGNLIGIFPGSRAQVIKWNFPIMLEVVKNFYQLEENRKYKFVIFGFEKYTDLYKKYLTKNGLENIEICYNNKHRKKIVFAISVSGTGALENMLYEIPMVIIYKLPAIMYFLIKKIILVKYISLPNIMLNKEIIPEFIQDNIDIKKIVNYMSEMLNNKLKRESLIEEFKKVKNILSNDNKKRISDIVSKTILEYVYGTN
ncbi:MAG: lipid-A-disaccharide synthase [Endomicrobiia bacterium]